MIEFLRTHWSYLGGAALLHLLFAGVFAVTMVSMRREAPTPQLAIQAVVVDQSVLNRASRQQQRQREREQAAAEAQRKRDQEAVARRDAEQRAEQERQAEVRRQEEEVARLAQQDQERRDAERKQAAQAQRQKQAEAERKRVAEIERKQKEEVERRRAAAESRAQQAREDELRRQLAEEEGRTQAENAGLLNQYIALIEQRVVRNWNRPPSARSGLECEVKVAQTPSGVVLSAQVSRCNGDAAVRQSIEAAVLRSSPLPPPPDPRLFERNLLLIFKPAE